MTPERWRQITEVFHLALARDTPARGPLLDKECAGDAALRAEVEAMLAAHQDAGRFGDDPLVPPPDEIERLEPGAEVGPYRIEALIGSGGMGEVYRAHDARLGRNVAIKVLAAEWSSDQERLRRFEQEARAVGALDHPNLLAVHDVGRHDGLPYLVFELLEGQTLRERLGEGPVPIANVLDYAVQLARGLAAAHDRGIVHRDLKPDNLFLTRDGRVKILDFGIAKLRADLEAREPDITAHRVVVGTAGYMSPEQLRGAPADPRSDLFALGAVLYELLCGRRAFRGESAVETMAAILEGEPLALAALRPGIPPTLDRIVQRCLEKRPEDRFQSAHDVASALEDVRKGAPVEGGRWAGRRWLAGAALVAVVLGGATAARFRRITSDTSDMAVVPFTSFNGTEGQPSFSPDGNALAFAWDGEAENNLEIYVKRVGAETSLRLTDDPAEDCCPSWSPDGRSIAFTRLTKTGGDIYVVPAVGGPEQRLHRRRQGQLWMANFVSWSPDGRMLAFVDKESEDEPFAIFLLSMETLERRRLVTPAPGSVGDGYPAFSPDGRSLAFIRVPEVAVSDIHVVPLAGGEPWRLTFDNVWIYGHAWTADGGSIVSSSSRGASTILWRVPLSGGAPQPLTLGVSGALLPAISRQGRRLAYVQHNQDVNVWRVDLDGSLRPPAKFIASTGFDSGPQFSPDGSEVAVCSSRSGFSEIWLCAREGAPCRQLTSLGGPHACTPRWSPDGREIAFDSRPEGHSDIHVVDVARRVTRRLTTEGSNEVVPSWSSDGRWVYFASNRSGTWQVWKARSEGGGPAGQVTTGGGFAAFESPGGETLYYAKFNEPGIWRVPTGGGEERPVVRSLKSSFWGYWAVAKKGLYFVNADDRGQTGVLTEAPYLFMRLGAPPRTHEVRLLQFADGRVSTVAAIEGEPPPGDPGLTVSPDGRTLLYSRLDRLDSDIKLLENFR